MAVQRARPAASRPNAKKGGAQSDRKDLSVRREESQRAVDKVISKTLKRYDEALRKLEKY